MSETQRLTELLGAYRARRDELEAALAAMRGELPEPGKLAAWIKRYSAALVQRVSLGELIESVEKKLEIVRKAEAESERVRSKAQLFSDLGKAEARYQAEHPLETAWEPKHEPTLTVEGPPKPSVDDAYRRAEAAERQRRGGGDAKPEPKPAGGPPVYKPGG